MSGVEAMIQMSRFLVEAEIIQIVQMPDKDAECPDGGDRN